MNTKVCCKPGFVWSEVCHEKNNINGAMTSNSLGILTIYILLHPENIGHADLLFYAHKKIMVTETGKTFNKSVQGRRV